MEEKKKWIVLAIISGFIALLFIPIYQTRVVSYGIDAYSNHKPIYGNRGERFNIQTTSHTRAIGIILVDMRRSKSLTDVSVRIADAKTAQTIAQSIIPKNEIRDDTFVFANLKDTPIPAGTDIQIEVSAPDATNQNPIGMRFEENNIEPAIALKERVPLWNAIVTIGKNRASDWKHVGIAAAASLLIAMPALFGKNRKRYWLIALGIIIAASLYSRFWIVSQFGGVSGGDAYNYLAISTALSEFQNPFEHTKRLPGYPLLLVPILVSGAFDEQFVMRSMQIIASMWAIAALVALARSLNITWPAAIASGAIAALQKDYFWTSTRPEPYALYTAFLITALWLYVRIYQKAPAYYSFLFGIILGYSAMVRQEGFVLAAVLGICSLGYELYLIFRTGITWRTSGKRFALMYLPALLIVSPFFIHNISSYGTPFYTPYLEGERLQIVDSFHAFKDAVGASWGVLGSMWKPAWDQLERLDLTTLPFMASVIGMWAWYALVRNVHTKKYTPLVTALLVLTWFALIAGAVYAKPFINGNVPIITAGFILASIPAFLLETKFFGIVILLVLISQIGVATWFHPFPKHYEQSYPLIALMIATALLARLPERKVLTASGMAMALLPFFLIASFLAQKVNDAIDRQNEDAALDSVTYRAARYARNLPGPIGFDQAYLPARLYFDPNAIYFPSEENPAQKMEQHWLKEHAIKTLVVTNVNNVFKKPYPDWKHLVTFKAASHDERIEEATIYELP
ncbi:MAG: hypothetical protein A3E36_04575 [Candidatus Andersenbacteria bacterium RIFCSPHIGHO2_12_FULL_45_11b]|uniref:Uncharacterized protein n=1 Tax=Candidatus Andersenbacteria bacterium RIFCSPHIGHO2_12_FULL_45_11b TaxID=1797282 RepID=A0A1G1XAG1_9BACT|nr:MAG: hypothetical protein A3E36_04575 [Candidatus Andersenbacteria bacterium RIFCSPHIGHO2_12_FULL_45_11b]